MPETRILPEFVTASEAPAALRLSESAIYRAVERVDLQAVRLTERGAPAHLP